jgi:hypothetical protein
MHSRLRIIGNWAKSGLVFLMHQAIGTEGVIWLTALGAFLLRSSVRQLNAAWADSVLMRGLHLMLTNTPFFPIQIACGGYVGWKLYRRWQHPAMLWVWILPGIVLTYAVIAVPTFSHGRTHQRTRVRCRTTLDGDAKRTITAMINSPSRSRSIPPWLTPLVPRALTRFNPLQLLSNELICQMGY